MIKFVIVEDDDKYVKVLNSQILSVMMGNKCEFEIDIYNDITSSLYDYINNKTCDTIYLLDLELPSGRGIDIARYIRINSNDWRSPIIICTVFSNLFVEAHKQHLQILDFISKNFDSIGTLTESIRVCYKILNESNCYSFMYKSIVYSVDYDKINYIQRLDRKTSIITKDGEYFQNISIADIKKNLPEYFIYSNKGIIVNAYNIMRIDWNNLCLYFKDGSKDYIVSKRHRKELDRYVN